MFEMGYFWNLYHHILLCGSKGPNDYYKLSCFKSSSLSSFPSIGRFLSILVFSSKTFLIASLFWITFSIITMIIITYNHNHALFLLSLTWTLKCFLYLLTGNTQLLYSVFFGFLHWTKNNQSQLCCHVNNQGWSWNVQAFLSIKAVLLLSLLLVKPSENFLLSTDPFSGHRLIKVVVNFHPPTFQHMMLYFWRQAN